MRNTPSARNYASPTRDKIFIWVPLLAGCGNNGLLGRHAAIHPFGTDQFTRQCTLCRFLSFQSVFIAVFNQLSKRFNRLRLFFAAVKSCYCRDSIVKRSRYITTDVQKYRSKCSTAIPENCLCSREQRRIERSHSQ